MALWHEGKVCYFHLTSFFLHFCKYGKIRNIRENCHCAFSRNIRRTNGFCLFHFRTTRQQQHVPGSLEVSSFKAKFSRETEVWTSNYLRGRPSNLHGNERDQSRLDQKLLANSWSNWSLKATDRNPSTISTKQDETVSVNFKSTRCSVVGTAINFGKFSKFDFKSQR